MRADRLLSLLMLLQIKGKLPAHQLAKELEVSERTIYHDIEALSMAGVPVYGGPGRDGGFALVDHYRTTLTGLSGRITAKDNCPLQPDEALQQGLNQPECDGKNQRRDNRRRRTCAPGPGGDLVEVIPASEA